VPPVAVRVSVTSDTSAASAAVNSSESRKVTPSGPHDNNRRGSPKATFANSVITRSAVTPVRDARAAFSLAMAAATVLSRNRL